MFLHLSVILFTEGVCVAGGACVAWVCVHDRGPAWWGRTAWQGGVRGRGVCMAGEMAIEAGGTHPTGMHYCLR